MSGSQWRTWPSWVMPIAPSCEYTPARSRADDGLRGWRTVLLGSCPKEVSLTLMPARGTVRLGGETLAVEGLASGARARSAAISRAGTVRAPARRRAGADVLPAPPQGRPARSLQRRRPRRCARRRAPPRARRRPARGARHLAQSAQRRHLPRRWRLTEAARGLVLEVAPRLAGQELIVGPRYWEGAV